jgi:outer membrane protein
MKKSFLIALLMVIAAVYGHAQDTAQFQLPAVWSLEDCVNYALTNNVDVKQQALSIEYGEESLLQSKLNMLPNLNGYASNGYNWGQTIDRFTNEFATERVRSNNFYLSSQFTLFNGLQQMNTIKKNEIDLLTTRYNVDTFMDDVSMNIAAAYLQILYFQELKRVAVAQLDITQQQVNRTAKMVDAGTLAKGDLLLIEAQLATEELNLINVQNNLDISYLTLVQLLDLPSMEGFKIEEPDLAAVEAPQAPLGAEAVYEIALGARPEVKAAELTVQSSEKTLALARGVLYPSLGLQGSWGTGFSGAAKDYQYQDINNYPIGITEGGESVYSIYPYSEVISSEITPFTDQIGDNLNTTVMLNLQIPIFNGWYARSNIAKAKIGIESAELGLESTKLTLRKVIQQSYADAVAALKTHNAAEKKVEATSESFKYADQKFNVGLINSVEYNEAKKELTKAQAELLQAKYDFIFKTTILDFYMGKPLTLKGK